MSPLWSLSSRVVLRSNSVHAYATQSVFDFVQERSQQMEAKYSEMHLSSMSVYSVQRTIKNRFLSQTLDIARTKASFCWYLHLQLCLSRISLVFETLHMVSGLDVAGVASMRMEIKNNVFRETFFSDRLMQRRYVIRLFNFRCQNKIVVYYQDKGLEVVPTGRRVICHLRKDQSRIAVYVSEPHQCEE